MVASGHTNAIMPQNSEETRPCHLPPEILWSIVSHLQCIYLPSICLVSRAFQQIGEHYLYKSIDCTGQWQLPAPRLFGLLSTLHVPRLMTLVTELRVALNKRALCWKAEGINSTCICVLAREQLGDIVASLPRLQKLYIQCYICHEDVHRHYECLTRLRTTQLRSLCFTCHCCSLTSGVVDVTPLLTHPSISGVEELGLLWPNGISYSLLDASSFQSSDILPNISTFIYDATDYAHLIVAHRPITRMQAFYKHYSLSTLDALDYDLEHKGQLTHFFSQDIFQSIQRPLFNNFDKFKDLRCIGAFQFVSYVVSRLLRVCEVAELFFFFPS